MIECINKIFLSFSCHIETRQMKSRVNFSIQNLMENIPKKLLQ